MKRATRAVYVAGMGSAVVAAIIASVSVWACHRRDLPVSPRRLQAVITTNANKRRRVEVSIGASAAIAARAASTEGLEVRGSIRAAQRDLSRGQ